MAEYFPTFHSAPLSYLVSLIGTKYFFSAQPAKLKPHKETLLIYIRQSLDFEETTLEGAVFNVSSCIELLGQQAAKTNSAITRALLTFFSPIF